MLPPDIPEYVTWVFIFTTILTALLLLIAARKGWPAGKITVLIAVILGVSALLAVKEFFLVTNVFPPRLMFVVAPSLLIVIGLFIFPQGRKFIDKLSPAALTLVHVVRIPVEIVLYWLSLAKAIPQLMTFEGRNFDILAGLTAPIIAYLMSNKKAGKSMLIVWNIIGIGLLMNIVIIAVLSAPFPFQQFAFDQPNVAVLYFPFVWLPCFIVPAVLFAHLATLRHLIIKKNIDG